MSESDDPLRPATYEAPTKEPAFGRRMSWAGIALALAFIVGAFTYHIVSEDRKMEAARERIHQRFGEAVGPQAERLSRFQQRMERWVLEAARVDDPGQWARDGFSIGDLRGLRGIYLRLNEPVTESIEELREAALVMPVDAIPRCLGLDPFSGRGWYERMRFLDAADTTMRLRVLEEQLEHSLARDLPVLVQMSESDYLILALVRGLRRHEDPVDFYVWDLRGEAPELMLRVRAEADGLLVPVRVALPGAPRQKRAAIDPRRSGAQDCSLAAQIRAATGEEPMGFRSEPPLVESTESDADEGAAAAGAERAAQGTGGEDPEGEPPSRAAEPEPPSPPVEAGERGEGEAEGSGAASVPTEGEEGSTPGATASR